MDPVAVKFMQLILAELVGAALCLGGIYLFVRGIAGKSNLLIEGVGLKAKLTNGAPGSVIALIGLVVIGLSLNSTVERTERKTPREVTLELWLQRSVKVEDGMTYSQVVDVIVGKDANARFLSPTIKIENPTSLGLLAGQEYGNTDYWRLLAAINKDRGYFALRNASEKTVVPANGIIEVWRPSEYDGMSVETRTRVAGENRTAAYDELLKRSRQGEKFDFDKLDQEFKARELPLSYSAAQLNGIESLRELSIKYYGDPKYWPIIVWTNENVIPRDATANTPISASNKQLYVIHFIGWPR